MNYKDIINDIKNRNIKNIDVKEIINKCNDIIKRLF